MTLMSGWGRFPQIEAEIVQISSPKNMAYLLNQTSPCIARGMGRSYGDSSLSQRMVDLLQLNHYRSFDATSGILKCYAGTTLADIIDSFLPKGWFLPVTPGTKFVTIGGAIASDVHGKNHHHDGCFSQFVRSLEILVGTEEIIQCSPTQNSELFNATCGGMGLTGIILTATIQLLKVDSSNIRETTVRSANLKETFDLFEEYDDAKYSVAWIDSTKKGEQLGRALLSFGEHIHDQRIEISKKRHFTIPSCFPSFALNHLSVTAFNTLYFHRKQRVISRRICQLGSFFYPLDSLHQWNRLYGKNGFVQYQFVLPKKIAAQAMQEILTKIVESGKGSFLSVLKLLGKANQNLLSFPLEGYTLALDFKLHRDIFDLFKILDKTVIANGGRIYLTKDACMSESTFKQSYDHWENFQAIREHYNSLGKFRSLQSIRLGLDQG